MKSCFYLCRNSILLFCFLFVLNTVFGCAGTQSASVGYESNTTRTESAATEDSSQNATQTACIVPILNDSTAPDPEQITRRQQSPSVGELATYLESDDSTVRLQVIHDLRGIPGEISRRAIEDRVVQDANVQVRFASIDALVARGETASIPVLNRAKISAGGSAERAKLSKALMELAHMQKTPSFQSVSVNAGNKGDGVSGARYALYAARVLGRSRDYSGASDQYRRAYGLSGDWTILGDLLESEKRAERPGLALEAAEHYLAQGGSELDSEQTQELKKEIEDLRLSVGYLRIKGSVSAVEVDGVPRCLSIASIAVLANTEHEVTAEGRTAKTVVAKPWETTTVSFLQEEVELEKEEVEDEPVFDSAKKKFPLQPLGWVSTGLGVGLLGLSIIPGASALKEEQRLRLACDGNECPPEYANELENRDKLATITNVLWITGGTLTVTGIVMLIMSAKKERKENAKNRPSFGIAANPDLLSGSIGWRF